MAKNQQRTLGIALGGGAARGVAHVGVLKALSEHNISISYVAGTSVGSLIGSMFCAGHAWDEILEISRDISWGDLVSPTFSGMGLVRPEKLEHVLNNIIENRTFDALEIPFKAVAADIETGKVVVLEDGLVARAVRASCSIPGIFEPVEINGRLLVDGGLVDNIPTVTVREMGADVVLGVDLNTDRIAPSRPNNVFDIFLRSLNVLMYRTSERSRAEADLLIDPDLSSFDYRNLERVDELVDAGYQAAIGRTDELREVLRIPT